MIGRKLGKIGWTGLGSRRDEQRQEGTATAFKFEMRASTWVLFYQSNQSPDYLLPLPHYCRPTASSAGSVAG